MPWRSRTVPFLFRDAVGQDAAIGWPNLLGKLWTTPNKIVVWNKQFLQGKKDFQNMFEEGTKNFWGAVDRDTFFKSQQCFCLIFKVVQKRKFSAVWQRCWSLQAGRLILLSQFTAVSPYVQHPWAACWCLSKLGCAWLSSSPSPCPKVVSCLPSWGRVLLPTMTNSSVKSFCLAQSLLSCCKFRFYNFWCFAGLFQLMSLFS